MYYDGMDREIENVRQEIKVIGLGGGGCNAVNRMLTLGYKIPGVEFIAANTDLQALQRSKADTKLLIGPNLTTGLGSGGRPEIGEKAALESEDLLREALMGADVVFLTAGMGGGTGSGAISVAARIAKELNAVTISVVSTPFSFEAGKRIENARNSLIKLASYSDTLITIPNDQLLKVSPKNITLTNAFAYADDVLRQGIMGITRLLTNTGEINVDFSHVREMMENGGGSFLSVGRGSGPNKVSDALYQALNHPLIERLPIENATGIIANFIGDENLSFGDVMEGLGYLQQLSCGNADIIPGQVVDDSMKDEVEIILIITGIASTPIQTLKDESSRKADDRTQVYRSYRNEPVMQEPQYEMAVEEPEPRYSERSESTSAPVSVSDPVRIIPTAPEVDHLTVSSAADAAYETFMNPLGLGNFESSPLKMDDSHDSVDTFRDLDTPTFIRRKL